MLIHFTQNVKHYVSAGLRLKNTTVRPTRDARYLGVIFDKNLKFHGHLEHVAKKAPPLRWHYSNQGWQRAARRAACCTISVYLWLVSLKWVLRADPSRARLVANRNSKYVRRLYTALLVPKIQ